MTSSHRFSIGSLAIIVTACTLAMPTVTTWAEDSPETIELTGVVRDFKERTDPDGHTDFEQRPLLGFGHYTGNVAPILGEDRLPVFTGDGAKVTKQWKNAAGQPICRLLYDKKRGDKRGSAPAADQGGIESAESFDQWFRDIPGVNLSNAVTLTLVRQPDGSYVFDDKDDKEFSDRGGFFPIDDQLFGNSGGTPDHNYHFTFQLQTEFTYDEDADQVFKFLGDDDVWVFIDGKLVIDLGGVHSVLEQFVELDRLGLSDGETYSLDFFFAERHRTQSNFRMQTNLVLSTSEVPGVTAAFD